MDMTPLRVLSLTVRSSTSPTRRPKKLPAVARVAGSISFCLAAAAETLHVSPLPQKKKGLLRRVAGLFYKKPGKKAGRNPGKNVDEAEAFSQSRQPKNVEVEQTVELEAELRDAAAEVLDSEAPEHQESDHNATTHTEERSSASPGGTLEENALEEAAFGKTAVEVRVVLGKNAEIWASKPDVQVSGFIHGHGKEMQEKGVNQEASSNDMAAVEEPIKTRAAVGETAAKVDEPRELSTQIAACEPVIQESDIVHDGAGYAQQDTRSPEARLDDRAAVEEPAELRILDTNEGRDQRVQAPAFERVTEAAESVQNGGEDAHVDGHGPEAEGSEKRSIETTDFAKAALPESPKAHDSAAHLPDTSSPDPSTQTTLKKSSRASGESTPNTRPLSTEPQDAPQTLKETIKGQSEERVSPMKERLENQSHLKLAATKAEFEKKHNEELISMKEELEKQHAKQLAAQKEQLQEEHKKEMATVQEQHTAVLETHSTEVTRLNGRYDRIHEKCRGYLESYQPIIKRAEKAEDLLHETEETLAECMKQAGIVQEEDKSDEIIWYGSSLARFRGCYEVARDQVKRLKNEKNEMRKQIIDLEEAVLVKAPFELKRKLDETTKNLDLVLCGPRKVAEKAAFDQLYAEGRAHAKTRLELVDTQHELAWKEWALEKATTERDMFALQRDRQQQDIATLEQENTEFQEDSELLQQEADKAQMKILKLEKELADLESKRWEGQPRNAEKPDVSFESPAIKPIKETQAALPTSGEPVKESAEKVRFFSRGRTMKAQDETDNVFAFNFNASPLKPEKTASTAKKPLFNFEQPMRNSIEKTETALPNLGQPAKEPAETLNSFAFSEAIYDRNELAKGSGFSFKAVPSKPEKSAKAQGFNFQQPNRDEKRQGFTFNFNAPPRTSDGKTTAQGSGFQQPINQPEDHTTHNTFDTSLTFNNRAVNPEEAVRTADIDFDFKKPTQGPDQDTAGYGFDLKGPAQKSATASQPSRHGGIPAVTAGEKASEKSRLSHGAPATDESAGLSEIEIERNALSAHAQKQDRRIKDLLRQPDDDAREFNRRLERKNYQFQAADLGRILDQFLHRKALSEVLALRHSFQGAYQKLDQGHEHLQKAEERIDFWRSKARNGDHTPGSEVRIRGGSFQHANNGSASTQPSDDDDYDDNTGSPETRDQVHTSHEDVSPTIMALVAANGDLKSLITDLVNRMEQLSLVLVVHGLPGIDETTDRPLIDRVLAVQNDTGIVLNMSSEPSQPETDKVAQMDAREDETRQNQPDSLYLYAQSDTQTAKSLLDTPVPVMIRQDPSSMSPSAQEQAPATPTPASVYLTMEITAVADRLHYPTDDSFLLPQEDTTDRKGELLNIFGVDPAQYEDEEEEL